MADSAAPEARSYAGQRDWFGREARRQRRALRDLQFQANQVLMQQALRAVREGNLSQYQQLRSQALGVVPGEATAEPEPTAHERYLDVRRVRITAFLLVALFALVALILLKSTSASAATPYVSLLSGLAGIALGWMFANSGAPLTQAGRRNPPRPRAPRT